MSTDESNGYIYSVHVEMTSDITLARNELERNGLHHSKATLIVKLR